MRGDKISHCQLSLRPQNRAIKVSLTYKCSSSIRLRWMSHFSISDIYKKKLLSLRMQMKVITQQKWLDVTSSILSQIEFSKAWNLESLERCNTGSVLEQFLLAFFTKMDSTSCSVSFAPFLFSSPSPPIMLRCVFWPLSNASFYAFSSSLLFHSLPYFLFQLEDGS